MTAISNPGAPDGRNNWEDEPTNGASLLRTAAQTLREKAEKATPGPWVAVEGASGGWWVERPHLGDVAIDLHGENARHIALMDPTVALAVADWLDEAVGLAGAIAEYREGFIKPPEGVVRLTDRALAVARAVLRRES